MTGLCLDLVILPAHRPRQGFSDRPGRLTPPRPRLYHVAVPRFKEHAVCIRHLDWSETSQIVVLLTEGRGTIRAVAKGSKRMSPGAVQRFSGGVELLTAGQAVGHIKASAELASLTEWDLQQPYPHLRERLAAHRLACYAADLCQALIAVDDPHPAVHAALMQLLPGLAEPTHDAAELLRFQWRLLGDVGYQPELGVDVQTGEPLGDAKAFTFDTQRGGLTRDTGQGFGRHRVRRETVELLRRFVAGPELLDDVPDLITAGSTDTLDRANRLLCTYLRALLDKELPTMRYVLGGKG